MGEKKIKGRKRHIVTDTTGHLLHVKVHAANTHDSIAGCSVFAGALEKYPTLKGVCADAGYKGTTRSLITLLLNKIVEISERITPKWAIIPKRWVVERTFAWFGSYRRLSKDYEIEVESAENNVMIAHMMLLLRRLA